MDKQKTTEKNRFILPPMDVLEVEYHDGCIWITQYETPEQKQVIWIPVEYLGMFALAIKEARADKEVGEI